MQKNKFYIQSLKYAIIILLVILAGAIGILLFESPAGNDIDNFFDAIWWALVTITTVGYGDLVPVTFWGRIIGIIFILMGFISFSIFTAFIASTFIDLKIKERKGLRKIKDREHLVICGWNESLPSILKTLSNLEKKRIPSIILINESSEDINSSIQNNYPNLTIKYVRGDFTSRQVLDKANIKQAKHIMILYDKSKPDVAPSDERTIIAAHNIVFMKLKGKISVQLHDEKYLPNIRQDKIHNVVIYDSFGGNILANSTFSPSIPQFLETILKNEQNTNLAERDIPIEFIGKKYGELYDYYKEQNLILLGIASEQDQFSIENILSDDSSNI